MGGGTERTPRKNLRLRASQFKEREKEENLLARVTEHFNAGRTAVGDLEEEGVYNQ